MKAHSVIIIQDMSVYQIKIFIFLLNHLLLLINVFTMHTRINEFRKKSMLNKNK